MSLDPDPTALEQMRRMTHDRSKWLQTATYEIAKYQYNREELNQFYDELLDVFGRVKSLFSCSLCKSFPKKSFLMPCSHFFCGKCSSRCRLNKENQSTCPCCKQSFDVSATPFYAFDAIVVDMNLFTKEAKYFQNPNVVTAMSDTTKDAVKKLKSMNFVLLQRLKNIECQLMCDFCNNRIQKTFVCPCSSDVNTLRPFCSGCDQKYIKFYEKEQGRILRQSFQFESFDSIVNEFYEFFDKTVEYSKTSKVPTRFLASNNGRISLTPIYKMIAGITIIGLVLLYYSA